MAVPARSCSPRNGHLNDFASGSEQLEQQVHLHVVALGIQGAVQETVPPQRSKAGLGVGECGAEQAVDHARERTIAPRVQRCDGVVLEVTQESRAHDHIDVVLQRGEDGRDVGGVVLTVRIQENKDLAVRFVGASANGNAFASVLGEPHDSSTSIRRDGCGVVR